MDLLPTDVEAEIWVRWFRLTRPSIEPAWLLAEKYSETFCVLNEILPASVSADKRSNLLDFKLILPKSL